MTDRPNRERHELNLPAIEKGGRFFTKYSPTLALDIVERIADGELLRDICSKDAEPLTVTKQTFLRWVATVPELSTAYSAALQISAQSFEEMAIDKAYKTSLVPGSPQNVSAASLLVSQYRWSAARRNPTRYSDKGNTQIVVPININTTLDMGNKRQTMDVEVPDIYTIKFGDDDAITEGEFSEVVKETETETKVTSGITKSGFRDLLRPDEPVIGTSRQPIYEATKNTHKGNPGPRKRVLVPRTPKEK